MLLNYELALKNWCCWALVLEKTLESPLDCKEIKLVNPKGNQSWIFFRTTDAEPEAPVHWPPDEKDWLTGKDLDTGKDWRQEKGITEEKMVGWHHWLSGCEFEQALEDGEGQGSLVCCSHGVAKSWTRLSNWTQLNLKAFTQQIIDKMKRQTTEWEKIFGNDMTDMKLISNIYK